MKKLLLKGSPKGEVICSLCPAIRDIDEPPWWPVTVLDINERGIRLKIDYSDGEKPFNGQPELKLAPEALAGLHFIRPRNGAPKEAA